METITKLCWAALALLHIMPAASAIVPGLTAKLYGVSVDADVGLLLDHRGLLFLGVFLAALYAIFDLPSRRLASIIMCISMIGFLLIYVRAGMPAGALRKIAIADFIGLAPLLWVTVSAWR